MSAPALAHRDDEGATRNLANFYAAPPKSPLPRPDLADTVIVELPGRQGVFLAPAATDHDAAQPIGVMTAAVAVDEPGEPGYLGRHRPAPTWWSYLADGLSIALARIRGAL